MSLKLLLVQDGKVIFEMPLSPTDKPRKRMGDELESFKENFKRFSRIFDAFSHVTRLRMMSRLIEEEEHVVSFADFMRDLDLNPKLVWENTRKLREGGLLTKTGRGKYRCSKLGQRAFIMMSLTLRHLLEEMEDF